MNTKKQELKDLIMIQGTIAQQLHQIRISKQLTMEQVCCQTGIPDYVLDNMEIGRRPLRFSDLYLLAKYYGKSLKIQFVDE